MDNKNTWTSLVARFFLSTAASILIITGLIKVLSLFGSAGMLAVKDPVFGISFGILMPLVGVTEISCRHPGFILPQWISCLSAHSLDEY